MFTGYETKNVCILSFLSFCFVETKEDNLKQKLKTALLLDKTVNYSSKEAYYTYTFYCLVSICNHCPPMENNDNSF